MKLIKLFSLLSIFALAALAAPEIYAAKIKNGEDVVSAMYAKYNGKWYKTMTFAQKTTSFKPDGTTQNGIWYEALSSPGKLRVDIDPLESGSGFIYADGTQHSFQNGKLMKSQQLVHSLLVLGFDVYTQPVEQTISQLKNAKFDLSIAREDVWQGRAVYVVGAKAGDSRSPQFWIDKKNLYFVRLLQPAGKDGASTQEIQFNKYERVKSGGWISPEVVFLLDGKRVFLEEYYDIQTNVPIAPDLYDAEKFMIVDRQYVRKKSDFVEKPKN